MTMTSSELKTNGAAAPPRGDGTAVGQAERQQEPGGAAAPAAASGAAAAPAPTAVPGAPAAPAVTPDGTPPTAPARPAGPHSPPAVASAPGLAPVPSEVQGAPRRRPRLLTRRVLLPILAVVLLVAGVVGYSIYREGQLYVSTDNAQLTGQPIQVGSMNAGRVVAVFPGIGQRVRAGEVLAQLALPSQVGTAQSGAPKMDFLGSGDTRVDITAPADGVVIDLPIGVGSNVAAGQAVVALVDPTKLYVKANIEETSIGRVRVGQAVQVHVDALKADFPGKVEAITPATASTFSLLPPANASGNFNKVTQLVPVRVAVNLGDQPTLLGTSVEVKIRVAD